jgi:hypothetical protein
MFGAAVGCDGLARLENDVAFSQKIGVSLVSPRPPLA